MTDIDPLSLVEISVESEAWEKDPEFSLDHVYEALKAVRNHFPLLVERGHVDVVLGDDALLKELNSTYRHQDKPTNVLSFPQEELKKGTYLPLHDFVLLGDIVLSYPTIKAEAINQGKCFSHHLKHLIIHGFLHLLGFDHEIPFDADEMESLEVKILDSLNIPNPYKEDMCE